MNISDCRVALVGCGDIGCRAGRALLEKGAEVHGLRRSPEKLPAGFIGHPVDVCEPQTLAVLRQTAFDYLLITLTPEAFTDEAYLKTYVEGLRHILNAVDRTRLRKVFWVSSTSVYHQADDSRVDELSPTVPERFSGRRQLQAEQVLYEIMGDKACVVRFAGIYREGRHRLLTRLQEGALALPAGQDYYTNRIHVADCAGVLEHLMMLDARGESLYPVYLGVDCRPARFSEVARWLSGQTGLPLAQHPEAGNRRSGSKRCSNRRLLQSGYRFIYPDYRAGLQEGVEALKASL